MQDVSIVRVLIVDDVADDTTILSMLLRRLGCDVQACNDPQECVTLATQFQPQLILLDYSMPAMSGTDIARELRAINLAEPYLLVARTGCTTDAIKRECLDAGFDDVLIKPVDAEQLTALLEKARGQLA